MKTPNFFRKLRPTRFLLVVFVVCSIIAINFFFRGENQKITLPTLAATGSVTLSSQAEWTAGTNVNTKLNDPAGAVKINDLAIGNYLFGSAGNATYNGLYEESGTYGSHAAYTNGTRWLYWKPWKYQGAGWEGWGWEGLEGWVVGETLGATEYYRGAPGADLPANNWSETPPYPPEMTPFPDVTANSQATHTSATTQLDSTKDSALNWTTFVPSGSIPANTSIDFRFRTSADASTWGSWTALTSYAASIDLAAALGDTNKVKRYLQVETTLANTDGASTPTLSAYTANYEYAELDHVTINSVSNQAIAANSVGYPGMTAHAWDTDGNEMTPATFSWSATCGTITSTGAATAAFTAPPSVPSPPTCTITATTTIDGVTKSGTTNITIYPCDIWFHTPMPGQQFPFDFRWFAQAVTYYYSGGWTLLNETVTYNYSDGCGSTFDMVGQLGYFTTPNTSRDCTITATASCGGTAQTTYYSRPNVPEPPSPPNPPPKPPPPPCIGPDCQCNADNSSCYCSGPDCQCTDPNKCPKTCVGDDCPCTGPDCKCLANNPDVCWCSGPDCNCIGPDCQKCTDPNGCPPPCVGADCKCQEGDCYCTGPDCQCSNPDFCPPVCTGPDCPCTGPDCKCLATNPDVCWCSGPNCQCTGPDCEQCTDPNGCPPPCIGEDCKCTNDECFCTGPNCECLDPDKCPCVGTDCDCKINGICHCTGPDCQCDDPNCGSCVGPLCCSDQKCCIGNSCTTLPGGGLTSDSVISAIIAGIIALVSLLLSAFGSVLTMLTPAEALNQAMASVGRFFGFFAKGKGRRKTKVGLVYDAVSSLPIPMTKVLLFRSRDNKLLSVTTSDDKGRFALETPPGEEYFVEVKKEGFAMLPKNFNLLSKITLPYEKSYLGETIRPTELNTLFSGAIPLRYAPDATKLIKRARSIEKFTRVFRLLNIPILLAGFIFSAFALKLTHSWFNWIVFCLYIAIFVYYAVCFLTRGRTFGLVVKTADSLPVDLAVVRAFFETTGKLAKTSVSNLAGHYNLALPKGYYKLLVEKPSLEQATPLAIRVKSAFTPRKEKIGMREMERETNPNVEYRNPKQISNVQIPNEGQAENRTFDDAGEIIENFKKKPPVESYPHPNWKF